MNRQASSAVIAVLAGFASLCIEPAVASADGPQAIATVASGAKPRAATVLTLKNAATTPGEKKTYEAVLTNKTTNAPIANKKVSFRIEGKATTTGTTTVPNGGIAIGEGTTDAEGRAKVSFSTPDLPQGAYALKASFAGDHEALGDGAEANLFIAKAAVRIELSDANWFESGSNILYITASLIRNSDGKGPDRVVTLTMNGNTRKLNKSGSWMLTLDPLDASTWKVKITFDGDDSTLAASAERTYTRPPKK